MIGADEIHAIPYNRAGDALRRSIDLLQYRAYPEAGAPEGEPQPLHDPALDALSFYLVDGGRVVSYAAVVHKQIVHEGATFWIAGLSCVATDPEYRRRGLGARAVGAATRYIADSTIDVGVFTCDPPLAAFYERAGAWQIAPDVVLIGNRHEGALTSASLQKAVLMRLFSAKARAAAGRLRRTTIDLDLPPGQFI